MNVEKINSNDQGGEKRILRASPGEPMLLKEVIGKEELTFVTIIGEINEGKYQDKVVVKDEIGQHFICDRDDVKKGIFLYEGKDLLNHWKELQNDTNEFWQFFCEGENSEKNNQSNFPNPIEQKVD